MYRWCLSSPAHPQSEMQKPLSEDLGLTGQHRVSGDDYKPSLRGSLLTKCQSVTSDTATLPQIKPFLQEKPIPD
jgi:hypothetical protein